MAEIRRCARCAKEVMRFKKVGRDAFGGPIMAAIPKECCHIPIGQKPKNGEPTYYCKKCFDILNKD